MPKFAIVFTRQTPISKNGKTWLRSSTGRHAIQAEDWQGAALIVWQSERDKRPEARIKIVSVYQASAEGWQPVSIPSQDGTIRRKP